VSSTWKRITKVLKVITLWLLIPVIVLVNGCSMMMEEHRDTESSGWLTARVTLINAGATADYTGYVLVLPRYFPSIWPFDLIVGCKALDFESYPDVKIDWVGPLLVVSHDTFAMPAIKNDECYGHSVVFKERQI
jgi:hypothetical protein